MMLDSVKNELFVCPFFGCALTVNALKMRLEFSPAYCVRACVRACTYIICGHVGKGTSGAT